MAITRDVVTRIAQNLDADDTHQFVVVADAPILGWFDPSRLDQVVTHLVGNAVKYSPNGGEVSIALREDDGFAELAITDQGIGIPEEARSNLFEPFYRVHTQSDPFGGSGLGLYISSQIVDAHGGTISVESRVDGGSTFIVRLPIQSSLVSGKDTHASP